MKAETCTHKQQKVTSPDGKIYSEHCVLCKELLYKWNQKMDEVLFERDKGKMPFEND